MTRTVLIGLVVLPGALMIPKNQADAPAASADRKIVLTGIVTDPLGTGMDRVLVLLTPVAGEGPVRSTISEKDGAYLFSDLSESLYRITAIKDGYDATVSRVSTWVQSRLDLILVPSGQSGIHPADASWILKAPRRDLLREVDGSSMMPSSAGGSDGGTERGPSVNVVASTGAAGNAVSDFLEAMDGEILQSFSETNGGSSPGSLVTGGTGTTTSLAVGSPIGDKLRWNLNGERAHEVTSWQGARIEGLEADAQRFRVGLRYESGEVGRLNMRAFYDHDSLLYQTAPEILVGDPLSGIDRKAWGYDADWSGRIGNVGDLQLDLRYSGSALGGAPSVSQRRELANAGELPDEIDSETNIWRTAARFSKKLGTEHEVNVGVRARMSSTLGTRQARIAPSSSEDLSLLSDGGRDGWTVSVNAAESWRVLSPVAVDFGFDVSRNVDSGGRLREAVIPQAGVTFTPGPSTSIRGVLSYVAVALDEQVGSWGGRDSSRATDSLGLRLRVEHALGKRLLFILDAGAQPFSYESIGARWSSAGQTTSGGGLYVSDEAADVREVNLALEGRPSARTTIGFGASAGRVQGQVAATAPDHELEEFLADRTLRYIVTHLSGRFEQTGTEVWLDLTRLDQASLLTGGESDYSDHRIDVKVLQGLRFVHLGRAGVSLVLAYSAYVPVSSPATERSDDSALHAEITRLSGGISVRF